MPRNNSKFQWPLWFIFTARYIIAVYIIINYPIVLLCFFFLFYPVSNAFTRKMFLNNQTIGFNVRENSLAGRSLGGKPIIPSLPVWIRINWTIRTSHLCKEAIIKPQAKLPVESTDSDSGSNAELIRPEDEDMVEKPINFFLSLSLSLFQLPSSKSHSLTLTPTHTQ